MKVLFVGDPHLKINRFELSKSFLKWLNSTIQELKPDVVVNLGDSFDTHSVLRSEIMTEFMNHVYSVLKLNIPYIYLVGNHDLYKPSDNKYHALSHLVGRIDNFYIIDKTQDLFDMTFVPYLHNPAIFPLKTLDICVAHQTFKGADYGNITTQDGVDSEAVSASIIISGHIHKKQDLGKVIYPGSPFSQGVNDINQIKGLMLFDTKTFERKFIKCPLPMWRGDKLTIEPGFTTEDMYKYFVNNLVNSLDHWTIEIVGPKAEIIKYLESAKHKKAIEEISLKIKTSFTDREKRQVRIESLSIDNIIAQYVAKVYSGSLNKSILTEKALDILKSTLVS
jgi:DNA repair exonuclease SbcCD nuclease subunit